MDKDVLKTIGWINYILSDYKDKLTGEELETLRQARLALQRIK